MKLHFRGNVEYKMGQIRRNEVVLAGFAVVEMLAPGNDRLDYLPGSICRNELSFYKSERVNDSRRVG